MQYKQEAVEKTPEGHPDLAGRLQSLAVSFTDQYQRSGDVKDLKAALQNNQAAVAQTPDGHPDLAGRLQNLAVSFTDQYRRSGDVKDLEAALQYKQDAVEKTPEGHPDLAGCLQNLAVSFTDRYRRSGDVKDLEAALQNNQAAVAQTPEGHLDLAGRLQSLAESFTDRYQRSGDVKDLEAALQYKQEAVEMTPEGHPDLAGRLQSLAVSFTDRYRRSGDVKDLEAALQNNQAAVAQTPDGHPDLAGRLQNLAESFIDRYQRSGDVKDLEAALQYMQAAVEKTPEGHPDLAGCLQSLAESFTHRYLKSGDVEDLKAALQNNQAAVAQTPDGHPDLAGRLQSLAVSFTDQYRRSGDVKDLEAALQNNQAAVAQTPEGHPDLAGRLQNLAVSFTDQYRRSGDVRDLKAALQYKQEAVEKTPEGHPNLPGFLQSLAVSFTDRYQRSGDVKDLEAALQNNQAAVAQTPDGHPDLAGRLQNLAVSFTDQYRRSGDVKDLEAALQYKQEAAAVAKTPEGHPNLPGFLQSLAVSFTDKYTRSGDVTDLEAALFSYRQSFQSHTSNPVQSWRSALKWASLAKVHRPTDTQEAYSAAFHLLPEILWIGSSVSVRQDVNMRINVSQATSDAIAACIDFLNLPLAVELLEQGLGTTFQQVLQLKTNIDFLPKMEADKLKLLSIDLYSGAAQHPQRVAADRNTLINEIWSRPGQENFLRPKPYRDLCQASQCGPIVVLNSHHDHCDAIILLNPTSDPLHLALPSVSVDHLKAQKSLLRDLIKGRNLRSRELPQARLFGYQEGIEVGMDGYLSWVWTCIVQPIYVALNAVSSTHLNGITSGRLWWCPTGDFTGLPLHAADSEDTFIQSYTPTLGALLEANSKPLSADPPHIGLVGVTHTGPRMDQELPGVEEEITMINSIARKQYQVQCLIGENTTVDSVKQALNDCAWMHLACHGEQNIMEPPKSCLQLYGGTLELKTILQMSLPNAEFVFLAACQTAKGDAALVNESFHLGGGFIAAGFQGAIATMWSMMDEDGPVVAETVYSHLLGSGHWPRASDVAKALQLAVRKLRDAGVPYERWVPFIHLGI
ncbi:CHAT domain-containing protein [Mycena rebaudengoi]|nr:CHAT domain-containing protein [Mycena rebaudengoi]